jgi:hypothetical protein
MFEKADAACKPIYRLEKFSVIATVFPYHNSSVFLYSLEYTIPRLKLPRLNSPVILNEDIILMSLTLGFYCILLPNTEMHRMYF